MINKRYFLTLFIFLFLINIFSYEYYPQFKDEVDSLKRFNEILVRLNINEKYLSFSEVKITEPVFDPDIMCFIKKVSQKDSSNSIVFENNTDKILYLTTLSKPFDKKLEKDLSIRLKAFYYAGLLFSIPLEQLKIKDVDKKDQNILRISFKRSYKGYDFLKDIAFLTMDNYGNMSLFENHMSSDLPFIKNLKERLTDKKLKESVQKALRTKVISYNGFDLDNMKIRDFKTGELSIVNPDYFLDDKLTYNNLRLLKNGGKVEDLTSYIPMIKKSFLCVEIKGKAKDRSVVLDFDFYVDVFTGRIIKTKLFKTDFEQKMNSMEELYEGF